MNVPDVRQPASLSGGSACPVPSRHPTAPGSIALRWSTALGTNPTTILTQNQAPSTRLAEIEQTISTSLATWTGVSGTALAPASLAPLVRTSNSAACGTDGLNSLCFDQPDMAFTPGVLAFTRVVTADRIGEQLGPSAVSSHLARSSTPTFTSIPAIPTPRSPRPPRSPPIPIPTTSNPSLLTNSATFSASATPRFGVP